MARQLKHWHTQHVHNITRSKCKHWVGHPTHAESSHYNACPDHTLKCFYDGVDLSFTNIQLWLHSQVTDYTMESRLPCGCWSNSWQNSTAYVIYTSYINIFQRRKVVCCLFGWNSLHKWLAHIHCKPFKKNTQIVTGDPCVLFHWQHEAQEGMREQNYSRH